MARKPKPTSAPASPAADEATAVADAANPDEAPKKIDQKVEINDAGPCKKHVKVTVQRDVASNDDEIGSVILSRAADHGADLIVNTVGGSVFAARPVDDSFALVRVPELTGVPVYVNSWYAGKTNAAHR